MVCSRSFLSFLGVDGSDSVERISISCNTSSISAYRYSSVYYVYHQGLGTYVPMTEYEHYNASAYATAVAAADKARANNSFKPSSVYFPSFPLNRETWYNISIVMMVHKLNGIVRVFLLPLLMVGMFLMVVFLLFLFLVLLV